MFCGWVDVWMDVSVAVLFGGFVNVCVGRSVVGGWMGRMDVAVDWWTLV